ncbi:MAG TPA: DUF3891 family protein [Tepidisphaeraceae bacterium]|jgi:hypothetical protein
MIRHRHADEFWLFTQHDHALLSGRLAEQIGGRVIARPSPRAIQGIALHDCGWPLHDDDPTLNPAGEPLHVFETPPIISTRVWSASASRAANKDPYSGLLVSLHVLHLSLMSQAAHRSPPDVFELNKFQHGQIELQEQLRPQVGLRIDRPLTHGLAAPGTSPEEDALLFDFRLLRAMDALSLALLCSEPMSITLDGLQTRPGGAEAKISLSRPAEFTVALGPSPFEDDALEFPVPYRRVPARWYTSIEEFHGVFRDAPRLTQIIRIAGLV